MEQFGIEMAQGSLKRVVALRLKPGTDVLLGLEEACKRAGISNGVILSGLGSLDGVRFCNPIYIPEKKAKYGYGEPTYLDEVIELTGLSGIICHDDEGVTNLHVHVTLSDKDGKAYGGHLVEGTRVLMTADIVLGEIEGVSMLREYDGDMDVYLLHPQQL